jgi:excinuclease ABC subunit A
MPDLSEEKRIAAQRIAQDLCACMATLENLGLGYLSMACSTPTLSPGELQRLRLATSIRSNLFGAVYVPDQPTAGLHPADGEALLDALAQLAAQGNSLFIVEHDLEVMRHADWLVDVGAEAGEKGRAVLYSGPPEGLRGVAALHTARYPFAEAKPRAKPTRGAVALAGVGRNHARMREPNTCTHAHPASDGERRLKRESDLPIRAFESFLPRSRT